AADEAVTPAQICVRSYGNDQQRVCENLARRTVDRCGDRAHPVTVTCVRHPGTEISLQNCSVQPLLRTTRGDVSARKTYDLLDEPTGPDYAGLLECALLQCTTAGGTRRPLG